MAELAFLRLMGSSDIDTVAAWLAEKENHKWLDFGRGVQAPNAVALRFMTQRDLHRLYVFGAVDGDPPVGVVGLSNIDRQFGTATLWYVLGDKGGGGRGHTTRAAAGVLAVAFAQLGLRSVSAWAVERNRASVRVLEKCGFRRIGIQRRCHVIDGAVHDRVLFDILPEEQACPDPFPLVAP